MGSLDKEPTVGQFMIRLVEADTKDDDPWQRNYFAPPQNMKLVPRSYPLIDVRPLISESRYDPVDHLRTHGFGVVRSPSSFLAQHKKEELTDDNLRTGYHPEVTELIKKTLGAKHVYIGNSVLRQGKEVQEEFKPPVGPLPTPNQRKDPAVGELKGAADFRKGAAFAAAKPIRAPHMDHTTCPFTPESTKEPLGARQYIRWDKELVKHIAVDSGIIAAEDNIVEGQHFPADSEEANALLEERYNLNGLGPRYAAFSIWRPLAKVGRDPIALCQRGDEGVFAEEYVHRPYLNKIPGAEELGGDYLREYAMLGVQSEKPKSEKHTAGLKWYYVSQQQPDEVLFIKLFDSAALRGGHAGAPYHASPEIGDLEGANARESLELRVFVFW
ncbi:uncharacterized protein LY89DRAFT_723764 [Mollisia scopiformis]|uniref:GA4 desaturase n=1 Tax=Mollisia scopiformis TaxID=149040 RepID=A0A132BD29_MOLSC|nr:uncharacterized protein LY89DRAFT_723764 [Mollisia scopiformis]KUJ09899.1 hypothetical protein LY89DRAFT_723764 [Mollisia scopiformis]